MAGVNIIVAVDNQGGIGLDDGLPWSLEKEWKHFLKLATRYDIITTHF